MNTKRCAYTEPQHWTIQNKEWIHKPMTRCIKEPLDKSFFCMKHLEHEHAMSGLHHLSLAIKFDRQTHEVPE